VAHIGYIANNALHGAGVVRPAHPIAALQGLSWDRRRHPQKSDECIALFVRYADLHIRGLLTWGTLIITAELAAR
jgi:hypothetical protein